MVDKLLQGRVERRDLCRPGSSRELRRSVQQILGEGATLATGGGFAGQRNEGMKAFAGQRLAECLMQRPQTQLRERLIHAVHAGVAERVTQAIPGMGGGGLENAPVQQHDVLVAVQAEGEAVVAQIACPAEVFEARDVVAIRQNRPVSWQVETFGEALLLQRAGGLVEEANGHVDRALGRAVDVVVEDDGALAAGAVGVGEDVFVHRSIPGPEVVEDEVRAFGKDVAVLE